MKRFEVICKKNEESTLANREQIDYLIQNCVAFGKRIKDLENHVKDDDMHTCAISKNEAIRAIKAIEKIQENQEIQEI